MTPEEAAHYRVDPFDVTKTWYEEDHPLIPLGKIVLNKNPINFFAEVEQVAFAPAHFVPGIWTSPDKLLQTRLMAYEDAHRYRLGANNTQIPINKPKACLYTTQRDGNMQVNGNMGNVPNYFPSSFVNVVVSPEVAPPPIPVLGEIKRHVIESTDADFVQPGEFYRAMTSDDKAHFIYNVTDNLKHADTALQYRQTALFYKADYQMGQLIAECLGLDFETIKKLADMTQERRVAATMPKGKV